MGASAFHLLLRGIKAVAILLIIKDLAVVFVTDDFFRCLLIYLLLEIQLLFQQELLLIQFDEPA